MPRRTPGTGRAQVGGGGTLGGMDIEQQAPVCYRHPDRATRLACSNCGRYICAECSHDAAVGQRCPQCAAPEHRTRIVRSRDIGRTDWQATPVSVGIIAATVLVFLLDAAVGLGRYSQFNPSIEFRGEWWRVFSAGFLHGGLFHLLINMYVLWIFGPRLEREAGSVPFAGLYFASMAAGGAAYYISYLVTGSLTPAVGASGAIFGLFGVWLVATYRIRHTPFGSSIFRQLVFWLGLNAVLPFVFPGIIAWEAHLGGLVAGAVIGWAWATFASGKPNAEAIRTSIAAAVLAIALAVVLFF